MISNEHSHDAGVLSMINNEHSHDAWDYQR